MRALILLPALVAAALLAGPATAQDKVSYNQYTLCAAATAMLQDVSSGNAPKVEHYAKETQRNYLKAIGVVSERTGDLVKAKGVVDDLKARATKVFQDDIPGAFMPSLGTCKDLGLIKMWEQ